MSTPGSPTGDRSPMSGLDLGARAETLFAAAEASDWDGFRAHFADDAVLRQNVGVEQTIAEAMVTLPLYTANGTSLRYENVRRLVGDRSVTEMHDAVFTKPDGVVVSIDICVVMQFNDDGLIVCSDEYLDSRAAVALMS